MLDEKEPKIQDKPDPSGRFVGPFRTWAETCRFGISAVIVRLLNNLFKCFFYRYKFGEMESSLLFFRNMQGRLQIAAQERGAECRPEAIGILDFLVLFDQAKRTDKNRATTR
ncbi:MAG: hypothetical protein V5804_12155 [Mucilaginibacter sp.]|uniref:hypothetical protein n=1 Tax=Mucilaginibacter sp. TaxID=1882438 RepID=UPI0034E61C75